AQVLPIWEGTTNVLSLDTLKALAKDGTLGAWEEEVMGQLTGVTQTELKPCVDAVRDAMAHASTWLTQSMGQPAQMEAGARRFAMTLGRTAELSLLTRHAQWCLDHGRGQRSAAAARRFMRHGVDQVGVMDADDARLLAH